MAGIDQTIEGPVSVVVTRDIKRKCVPQYETWLHDLGTEAHRMDPGMRMTVIKPGGSRDRRYVVVLTFTDHDAMEKWESSDVRKSFKERLKPMEHGSPSFSEVTGFEYWFSLPRTAATRPPARYKMALVTVIGLYLLSLTYTYTLNHWLEPLPDHAELVIRLVIVVAVMTFVLMPLLTRLFARWLYPGSSRAPEDDGGLSEE
jgi:uncharacterized protein